MMKNTKRYLSVVIAALIAVTSLLALSSCGHEHEYDPVVTKPTCTERGYTKYVCSCGESYIDENTYVDAKHDLVEHAAKQPNCKESGHEAYVTCKNCEYTTYKEIASTGDHYYDESIVKIPTSKKNGKAIYTCDGCGDSYEREITLADIKLPDIMGTVASIIGDGYYSIDLGDGFNLICLREVKDTLDSESFPYFEATKSFYAIKLPKAYIDIKDNYIKSEFTLEVGIAHVAYDEEDNPDEITLVEFESKSTHSLVIDGDKISTKFESGEETDEYEATVHELIVFLASKIVGQDIEYDTALEVYAVLQQLECFVPVFETISEKLSAPIEPGSEPDISVIINLLTALGSKVVEVTEDGEDTVYTLKLENLSEYVTYLKTATVADIIDDCFGEGLTASISEFIVGLPALTVKQIADAAIEVSEAYGLNVDEFYALVNGAVYLYANYELDIASEIDKRNEYTLAKLIAELMGAPEANLDDIAKGYADKLSAIVTLVTSSTVDELFGMFMAKPEADDKVEDIDESLEEDDEPMLITDMLSGVVAMLGDTVSVQVKVDKAGNVKNAEFSIAENANGSYIVNSDGSVTASLGIYGYVINYSSKDGVYTVIAKNGDTEILNGELTVNSEGCAFDGKLTVNGIEADLTASYTFDGKLDVLLAYAAGNDNIKVSLKYDEENFDVVVESNEKKMFELYADMLEGALVKLKIDVHANLESNETEDSNENSAEQDSYSHIISLTYTANDDGTYSLKFESPVDEVVVDINLNLATGTINLSGKQYGKNLFVCEIVVTEEEISMGMTMYLTEEDADGNKVPATSRIDISLTAEEFKYVIRYNNLYDILNMQVKFEDGKITSATVRVEDIAYDDEGNKTGYYDLVKLTYTTEGDKGNLVFEYYKTIKIVAELTMSENGVKIDASVVKYVAKLDEDGKPTEEYDEVLVFDGEIGVVTKSEDGTHSLTLSADVKKILSEKEDEEVIIDNELFEKFPIPVIKKLLLIFNGEITFTYVEAE